MDNFGDKCVSRAGRERDCNLENVLATIRTQVTTENFKTYFRPIQNGRIAGDLFIIEVSDSFFGDWIKEHYLDLISQSLENVCGRAYTIEIETVDPLPDEEMTTDEPVEIEAVSQPQSALPDGFPLNPRYSFDSFVVGPGNELAHAASIAVAEEPAITFNPLFIYGGTGLGKTHLLHSIARRITQKNPSARITYISAEEFTNQVIKSIQRKKMDALRQRYRRNCDILLMDDIHVLAGKEATQEEFFHTFNALHGAQKQIILTSDRPPQEISRLEERLRSRFQWGLITDISPPQFETRVAILQAKAEVLKIRLPNEVSYYLARHVRANVRELEGALTRLSAYANINRSRLSMELAKQALRGLFDARAPQLTIDGVIQTVAEHFGVQRNEICGRRRHRSIAHPRSIAMYLCRKHVQASFPEIGRGFGGKDHTTVIAACRKVDAALEKDDRVREEVENLERKIGS